MSTEWLLITYRVPAEPSARRITLWRKLKGLGAIYLQSGVCVLPRTDDHLRRLKVLEHDIHGMDGECVLLQAVALDPAQQDKVIQRFKADRDEQYQELLGRCDDFDKEIAKEIAKKKFTYAELDEEETDLRKLLAWFEKIRKLDFYDAPLAATAAARLRECEVLLDGYAKQVFEAHDENR